MEFSWGKRALNLDAYTGAVMSSSKWSETHVSSSGGGGYLHNGTGHVSAPTVSSTVSAKHEFWFKTEEGREIPVQLTDADFPLAPGQRITMVSATATGADGQHWIFVENHNADQRWILNANTDSATKHLQGKYRIWSIGVFVGLLILATWHVIFGLAAFGYLGYRLFQRKRTFKAIREALVGRAKEVTKAVTPRIAQAQ